MIKHLVVAAAATATVAAGSVGAAQLRAHSVTHAKLHADAVRSAAVRDHTLGRADFTAGALPGKAFTPIAVFQTTTAGALLNEAHRAPVAGALTSQLVDSGAGIYVIGLPGIQYKKTEYRTVCSSDDSTIATTSTDATDGYLVLVTYHQDGSTLPGYVNCAVYDKSG